jgi:hypothetical protein
MISNNLGAIIMRKSPEAGFAYNKHKTGVHNSDQLMLH